MHKGVCWPFQRSLFQACQSTDSRSPDGAGSVDAAYATMDVAYQARQAASCCGHAMMTRISITYINTADSLYLEADSGPRHTRSRVLKHMLEVHTLLTQQCLHDREPIRSAVRAICSSPLSFFDTFSICNTSPGGSWRVGGVSSIAGLPAWPRDAAL